MNKSIRLQLLGLLFLCLIGLIATNLSAQSFMSNPAGRNFTSLNGNWQVIVDWYNRGTGMAIYQDRKANKPTEFVEYSFDKQTLKVPGD